MNSSASKPSSGFSSASDPVMTDGIFDDLFHGCAWAAFVELAQARRGMPDAEATRRLAYRYYEEELAGNSLRSAERIAPRRVHSAD